MISVIVFHPIVEEFVFRGLFFGVLLFAINAAIKPSNLAIRYFLVFLAVLIQALIFGLEYGAAFQFYQALLLVGLFIGHKKMGGKYNLVPPIIAHATHNVILVISTCT